MIRDPDAISSAIIYDLVRQLGGKATVHASGLMPHAGPNMARYETHDPPAVHFEILGGSIEETVTVVERALPAPGENP